MLLLEQTVNATDAKNKDIMSMIFLERVFIVVNLFL